MSLNCIDSCLVFFMHSQKPTAKKIKSICSGPTLIFDHDTVLLLNKLSDISTLNADLVPCKL